jgi:hypothetical protein
LSDVGNEDFLVTIPFSFIAKRLGIRFVLWCNLIPRIFMSAWAIAVGELAVLSLVSNAHVVGQYGHILPTRAIIASPFLNVLGGECVFQSTIFTLTSALTREYVQQ